MERPVYTPVKLSRGCNIPPDYRVLKSGCGKAIWEHIPSKLRSPNHPSVTVALRSILRTEHRIYPPSILQIVIHLGSPWAVMEHSIGFDNAILAINLKTAKTKRLPIDAISKTHRGYQSPHKTILWLNQLAANGKPFAMHWLGEWHYDSNVPKSIWYHVAAARRIPKRYIATLQKAVKELDGLVLYDDMPDPCLEFLSEIGELNAGVKVGSWQEAINRAEKAIHHPVRHAPVKKPHTPHPDTRLFISKMNAKNLVKQAA